MYTLTAVPLSIATGTGELRQSPKHVFRNYLIDESKSVTNGPPSKARWIVGGIAIMRSVKARDTYLEWMSFLLNFISPPIESSPTSVEIINYTYFTSRCSRAKIGEIFSIT